MHRFVIGVSLLLAAGCDRPAKPAAVVVKPPVCVLAASCVEGCQQGSGPACVREALRYSVGHGLPRDAARARTVFRRACELGEGEGCLQAAYFGAEDAEALRGRGGPLVQRECAAGRWRSCKLLAMAHRDGAGVARDRERAREATVRAAALAGAACETGDAEACREAASLHEAGKHAARSRPRAIELYRRACDWGDLEACVSLGRVLVEKESTDAEKAEAVARLARTCDAGEPGGCVQLASCYQTGGCGVAVDPGRWLEMVRRGCELGNLFGECTRLGEVYLADSGGPDDEGKARDAFARGCEGGSASACLELALLTASGRGGSADEAGAWAKIDQACVFDTQGLHQACAWRVAERGCLAGGAADCRRLGLLWAGGAPTLVNAPRLALAAFERACAGDDVEGCAEAGALAVGGPDEPGDPARAARYLDRACTGGSKKACFHLGLLHEAGVGVRRDLARAAELKERGKDYWKDAAAPPAAP